MTMTSLSPIQAIARLNDRARLGLDRTSKIVITRTCLDSVSGDHAGGVIIAQAQLYKAIRDHEFVNDVYGERDFGAFDFRGHRMMFKVDYYDLDLVYGSDNPADASQTRRVITIMLAEDY